MKLQPRQAGKNTELIHQLERENAALRQRIQQLELGYDELRKVCNRQKQALEEAGAAWYDSRHGEGKP